VDEEASPMDADTRGRNLKESQVAPKTEVKKTINDYNYYLGSLKQASDYQVTTKFIINHILTTYKYGEDIRQALEEESEALTDMWVPDLQKSTNTDPAAKAKEDEEFKMLWKAKLNEYIRRKCTYKNNSIKAYGLLWQHCTKGMNNKIKSRTDFQGTIL
jgi:predicted house-cleaning noncanonical NTP pyrophosphatase (MazG superfamily)